MNNLPGKYRFQIRTFLIIILALSILAIVVSRVVASLWYRTPPGQIVPQTIPYDWTGRLFGCGLIVGASSFLLLLNVDKNIGRAINKDDQSYTHTPGTGRKIVARIIWIVVGVCILLFLFMFAWLSAGFHG